MIAEHDMTAEATIQYLEERAKEILQDFQERLPDKVRRAEAQREVDLAIARIENAARGAICELASVGLATKQIPDLWPKLLKQATLAMVDERGFGSLGATKEPEFRAEVKVEWRDSSEHHSFWHTVGRIEPRKYYAIFALLPADAVVEESAMPALCKSRAEAALGALRKFFHSDPANSIRIHDGKLEFRLHDAWATVATFDASQVKMDGKELSEGQRKYIEHTIAETLFVALSNWYKAENEVIDLSNKVIFLLGLKSSSA